MVKFISPAQTYSLHSGAIHPVAYSASHVNVWWMAQTQPAGSGAPLLAHSLTPFSFLVSASGTSILVVQVQNLSHPWFFFFFSHIPCTFHQQILLTTSSENIYNSSAFHHLWGQLLVHNTSTSPHVTATSLWLTGSSPHFQAPLQLHTLLVLSHRLQPWPTARVETWKALLPEVRPWATFWVAAWAILLSDERLTDQSSCPASQQPVTLEQRSCLRGVTGAQMNEGSQQDRPAQANPHYPPQNHEIKDTAVSHYGVEQFVAQSLNGLPFHTCSPQFTRNTVGKAVTNMSSGIREALGQNVEGATVSLYFHSQCHEGPLQLCIREAIWFTRALQLWLYCVK